MVEEVKVVDMKLDWRFWLGLYVGLRIAVEACERCKPEWEGRLERLLSRCEEELDAGKIVESLLKELLSGL